MSAPSSRRYLPSTRNPLHLLVALLVVVAIGLFASSRYATLRQSVNRWTLVPDAAVLVLETTDSPAALRRLTHSDLWPTLLTAPAVQRTLELAAELDSLHNSPRQTLARFLTGKRLLISVHPGIDSGGGAALLLLIPIESVRQHRYVRTLLEDVARSPRFSVSRREINDLIVTSIGRPAPDSGHAATPVLAVASYRNTLLVSPSPALIEQAVRRIGRGTLRVPNPSFAGTDYLRVRGTWANAWVNFRQLPAALAPLFGPATRPAIEELSSLGRDGLAGLELRNEVVRLNGFTTPEAARGALAGILGRQVPRPIRLWRVVSARSALLLHLGLPSLRTLRTTPAAGATIDSVESTLGPQLDSVLATLRDEVALCLPGTSPRPTANPIGGVAPIDRLAYAYSPEPLRTVRALSRLPGGRGGVESFGGYVIRPVRVPELPRRLFGALFDGFDPMGTDGAVVLVGHYAIFGTSAAALRTLLQELAAGHGLRQPPPIMTQGQRAATLTLYVNTANVWGLLQRALQPDRRTDALRNESLLRRFPSAVFQVSRPEAAAAADGSWYTTLAVQHTATGEVVPGETLAAGSAPVATTTLAFDQLLTSAPVLVRGGVGGPDVVVQDAAGILHAVDAAGRVVWADTLAGALAAPPVRTPTGAGRARLLLATSARLYALEAPSGHEVDNFPFYLSDSLRIQHLSAFTAGAPDFTLFVDDPGGNLYAFDARGRALPGWQPRAFEAPLADAPRAVRVEGRDLLVVALTNGDVFVLDHTGGVLPGFPVSADGPLAPGALAVTPAATLRASRVSVVTTSGQLSTFSGRAETLVQRALPRGTGTGPTRFELVPYDNGTAGVPPTGEFIVSRQEQGRVTLLNPETGTVRLTRGFLTAAPKVVQAFRLSGGGGTVFALTERGPARTYLFDERGQPLAVRVLDSGGPIALTFNPQTGDLIAWTTTGKTLRRFAFQR
ncbi:MAG: hypothetical protein H7330_09210 [Hymenobacteraceae bacterium]|nr:hypothetical protein [Hymenobacteraceae bacterium]